MMTSLVPRIYWVLTDKALLATKSILIGWTRIQSRMAWFWLDSCAAFWWWRFTVLSRRVTNLVNKIIISNKKIMFRIDYFINNHYDHVTQMIEIHVIQDGLRIERYENEYGTHMPWPQVTWLFVFSSNSIIPSLLVALNRRRRRV